jgi:ABC-type amino acid transport substrate-binding protein
MAKILTVALVVIMLVVGFGVGLISSPYIIAQNSGTEDSVWENIQKTGVIKVGTDPTWEPYQFRDAQNNIVGFEVDLANAVAAKLNLTIQWNDVGFGTIITSVRDRQFDMGVSGFSIRPDRLEQVSFTVPHSVTMAQVIMLQSTIDAKHITKLHSLSQLKDLGIVVGSQIGEVEEQELKDAGVETKSWSDSASAVQDMVSANPSVQAVYAETPITTAWIGKYEAQGHNIGIIYEHQYYPVAFLVNKNANTFLDKVNGALVELIYDGTVDHLKAQWHA